MRSILTQQNPASLSNPRETKFPPVSVIVPTYNRPEMLAVCLRSILHQTYPNVEIIVVNDGGVDVKKIIDSLNQRNKITSLAHPSNRGMAAARNTGVAVAR